MGDVRSVADAPSHEPTVTDDGRVAATAAAEQQQQQQQQEHHRDTSSRHDHASMNVTTTAAYSVLAVPTRVDADGSATTTQSPRRPPCGDTDMCTTTTTKPHLLSFTAPPAPPPPRDYFVSPYLVVCLSLVTFVLSTLSVALPWYRRRQFGLVSRGGASTVDAYYAYKSVHTVYNTSIVGNDSSVVVTTTTTTTTTSYPGDLCWPVARRTWALFAFAIVSACASALFCITSVLSARQRRTIASQLALPAMVAVALSLSPSGAAAAAANTPSRRRAAWVCYRAMHLSAAATFLALTATVSLNFNIFLWSFADCGVGSSFHSQLYEPYISFGFAVTAWALAAVGGIISSNPFTLPYDARTVDMAVQAFVMLSFVGFLFSLVSCPITHWFYKNSDTNMVTDVLLWRHNVKYFDWNITAPHFHQSTWVSQLACPSLVRHYRAAEVVSVVAIACNAFAVASGFLLWKSLLGTRLPTVCFSYAGAVCLLVQLALELRIFYGDWCEGRYHYSAHYYVLGAGFALMASALCVMCVACAAITVAYVLTLRYFPAKRPIKTLRQIAIEEYR